MNSLLRFWLATFALITFSFTPKAEATPEQKARLMWERIVGSYADADQAKVAQMAGLISSGNAKGAAAIATAEKRFVDYTINQLVAPWSNREKNPNVTYNSAIALAQGIVRDNKDFREIMSANYLYITNATLRGRVRAANGVLGANANTAPPLPVRTNEFNWQFIEDNGLSASDSLVIRAAPQWPDVTTTTDFSGIYTLGTSKHLYAAGTNRRPVEWTFQTFMCKKDLAEVMDTKNGDSWVGRDVDRGDFAKYKTQCIGCHGSVLDPLRGAFAMLDNDATGQIAFLTAISPKYNQNNSIFPDGYVTTNNSWELRANQNGNRDLGWRGSVSSGTGVNAFAKMVSDSEEFSRCMVTHVFTQVCLREPTSGEKERYIRELARTDFENQGYSLRKVYEGVAAINECTGE